MARAQGKLILKAKNIAELRDQLLEVGTGLRNGVIDPSEVKEFSNVAGKITGTLKCELEYAALRKVVPKITFLETE